jgi:aminoglycoside phosphotransferase (APT) family kinase protein
MHHHHQRLHRDLHDKQLILDETGVGLIDFDLAALGDPSLDLANLVVHLQGREAQGRCRDSDRPSRPSRWRPAASSASVEKPVRLVSRICPPTSSDQSSSISWASWS